MLRLRNRMMSPLRLLQSDLWPLSTAVAPLINEKQPIEEEKTPYYDPKRFYPTRLGEVLNGRYQVTTKLGYGTSSTLWLARDLFQLVLALAQCLGASSVNMVSDGDGHLSATLRSRSMPQIVLLGERLKMNYILRSLFQKRTHDMKDRTSSGLYWISLH